MASQRANDRFDAELQRSRAQLSDTMHALEGLRILAGRTVTESPPCVTHSSCSCSTLEHETTCRWYRAPAWTFNDGGRAAAGFEGFARDCVTRAIAIGTDQPYQTVYDALNELGKHEKRRSRKQSSARTGVWRDTYEPYLKSLGWRWVATMQVGQGCRVHLRADELPRERIIVRLSGHVCAVVDGVAQDINDPTRGGTRCVYGYFIKDGRCPVCLDAACETKSAECGK